MTELRAEAIRLFNGVGEKMRDTEQRWSGIAANFGRPLQQLLQVQIRDRAVPGNMNVERDAQQVNAALPEFFKDIQVLNTLALRQLSDDLSTMQRTETPEELSGLLNTVQVHLGQYYQQAEKIRKREEELNRAAIQLADRLVRIGGALSGKEYAAVSQRVMQEAQALNKVVVSLHDAVGAARKNSQQFLVGTNRAVQLLQASLQAKMEKPESPS